MKVRTLKKDKVNIITLGCSKNMVDSEVLSGQLRAAEIDVVHESARRDHNIVIVNTCGFNNWRFLLDGICYVFRR